MIADGAGASHPGGAPRAPGLLILAADHRARGLITVERYADYLGALQKAMPHCDGVLASAQPLGDLAASGAVESRHRTYLSLNRTGLSASAFELDDRLVASVERGAREGWTGVKVMTRIAMDNPVSARALELLGQVLEEAAAAGLEALVEPVVWRDGAMARDTESIVYAAAVAHDMGAPLLKVPVPDVGAGERRRHAVARVTGSVGVPVLFLGGPREGPARERVLAEARDVMAGGAAGLAIGRTLYQDDQPGELARELSELVHGLSGRVS